MRTILSTIALVATASLGHSMAPPSERPATPPIQLTAAIEIAEAVAKSIDKNSYCGSAAFQYASMGHDSDEFLKDTWRIVFYRPNSRLDDSGKSDFNDIEIWVTLDGKKTKVISK